MGITDTTKLSEIKDAYDERRSIHQQIYAAYRDQTVCSYVKYEALVNALGRARTAIINSGALRVDEDGNVRAGWYAMSGSIADAEDTKFADAGLGVRAVGASMTAAIGSPVAAWMTVGVVGTASTGTAISRLSGAASTAATAAWFGGGSVASGGLGMAAAPFALGGIGAVAALPVYFVMGARAAGKKEERHIEDASTFENMVSRAETLIEEDVKRLQELDRRIDEVTLQLIQDTTLFEFVSSRRDDSNVPTEETTRLLNVLWLTIQKAEELIREVNSRANQSKRKLYLEIPSEVTGVEATPINSAPVDSATIEVSWAENSADEEVTKYEVWAKRGRLGRFDKIAVVPITVFRHHSLEPDTLYQYQITAANSTGVSPPSETVSARTFPID